MKPHVAQAQSPKAEPHPTPPPPPSGTVPVWEWITRIGAVVAILVAVVGAPIWINSKVDDTRRELSGKLDDNRRETNGKIDDMRKDVADLRAEVARQSGMVTQIDARVTRIEQKVGLRPGPDVDAGPDGGPTWSAEHIERRERFCRPKCNIGGPDMTKAQEGCYERCSADFNMCGIKCPQTPVSACFRECVAAIRPDPSSR